MEGLSSTGLPRLVPKFSPFPCAYLSLEAGEKVDEEGVPHGVGHLKDPLLGQQRLDLVPGNDVPLLEGLDGEVLASVLVPRQRIVKLLLQILHTNSCKNKV